jgi:hypothetical protein
MGETDNRARLKQWLESGEARLQPLSFPQRELWETSPVPVGDPANHICGIIEIKGSITPEESEAAIRRVVDRQEALRTSFLPGKDRPLQLVRTTGTALQTYRELTASEARPEALEELMREVYLRPFDMMQGPLNRVEMMSRGPNDHVLAFSIHHLIADGWSLGVFVQDLSTAYVMGLKGIRKAVATGLMGLSNSLPPVPQTHTQWAAGERAVWTTEALERCGAFWKDQLAGSRLIWGAQREVERGKGPLDRWVSSLSAPLTSAVKELAQKRGTTLFNALLAAFQVALWKWTGRDDMVVGSPVANRNKEVVRQTMGYFAGVVPLRGQVDGGQSFAGHLRAVHERSMDCFANAMPFAELAARAGGEAEPGGHRIFDVRFALQNHPVPDVDLPRISTRLRMRSTGTARFDLGCEITETGTELEVVWLHREAMLGLPDLKELDALFRSVVTNACRSPESANSALTAITP